MSGLRLQKHERAVIAAIENLGVRVEVHRGRMSHRKMTLTLPSGRTCVIGMATSPKNADHTLKAALRQVNALLKKDREMH